MQGSGSQGDPQRLASRPPSGLGPDHGGKVRGRSICKRAHVRLGHGAVGRQNHVRCRRHTRAARAQLRPGRRLSEAIPGAEGSPRAVAPCRDSQGFCCECNWSLAGDGTQRTRGNLECSYLNSLFWSPGSASCLRHDENWWHVVSSVPCAGRIAAPCSPRGAADPMPSRRSPPPCDAPWPA